MDILKRKKTVFIVIALIVVGLLFAFFILKNGGASANDQRNEIQKFVAIQKSGMEMRDKLGQDTPYSLIYVAAKSHELAGAKPEAAVREAESEYLENQALLQLAEKNGIKVSDSDVKQYIEKNCKEGKSAQNYSEIEKACEKENITFEDTFYKNFEYYKTQYIINLLDDKLQKKYVKDNKTSKDSADADTDNDDWNDKWADITKSAVTGYKNSADYKKCSEFLKDAEKLYLGNDNENISMIKKVDQDLR